ncbi:hypothetical protein NDU88_006409 [Pleurodeles waltl]|uniref:Uncharacterized protein n=1 Tax=Pleurodeles waltl TaxID=8319 RepID=A0AAV7QIM7_PLEWA|nr:hypothetical protein NDU88_006409 [Pleurodeles waltl]
MERRVVQLPDDAEECCNLGELRRSRMSQCQPETVCCMVIMKCGAGAEMKGNVSEVRSGAEEKMARPEAAALSPVTRGLQHTGKP